MEIALCKEFLENILNRMYMLKKLIYQANFNILKQTANIKMKFYHGF